MDIRLAIETKAGWSLAVLPRHLDEHGSLDVAIDAHARTTEIGRARRPTGS